MSIKYFFNTHISRKGVYLIIYRVSTEYILINLRQFMTLFKRRRSNQHRVSGGGGGGGGGELDNVYSLILSHKWHDLQFRYRFSQKQQS